MTTYPRTLTVTVNNEEDRNALAMVLESGLDVCREDLADGSGQRTSSEEFVHDVFDQVRA
jgi:hypothetical protein